MLLNKVILTKMRQRECKYNHYSSIVKRHRTNNSQLRIIIILAERILHYHLCH